MGFWMVRILNKTELFKLYLIDILSLFCVVIYFLLPFVVLEA